MSQYSGDTTPMNPQITDVQGSAVRRVHTIAGGSGRLAGRIPERRESEEAATEEYEDDEERAGSSALANEKLASLQRNLSLPSKYHRVIREQAELPSGSLASSKSVGGLSSVDAGPEDDWSDVARAMYDGAEGDGDRSGQPSPGGAYSADLPNTSNAVRRHVSMTDGPRARKAVGIQRHPTMAGRPPARANTMNDAQDKYQESAYAEDASGDYDDPSYAPESAYAGIQDEWEAEIRNDQDWPEAVENAQLDWRMGNQSHQVDVLTQGLSNLDLQQQQQQQPRPTQIHPRGPRFESTYPEYSQQIQQQQNILNHAQRINTEVSAPTGPNSASAYIPQPGHGHGINRGSVASVGSREEHHRTASGSEWSHHKEIKGRNSNPNLGQSYQNQYNNNQLGNIPPPPPIPSQYLNQMPGGRGHGGFNAQNQNFGAIGSPPQGQGTFQQQPFLDPSTYLSSPIDVPTMIAQKGYNPATFDTRPAYARYFVIKSYTEDDVHKSLKYEIWSSTDPGNKRLDKAFRESSNRGPIYLFFSVNASGHFCGMAEMLTPVDYTRSSTVWASDKWKGVFKVRWIFVRDIPNAVLRNIRLNNTQERKPVTNSRDTQELLPEAGHEMLRIFFTHPAKTSLLQDFAFYELQSLQKQQQQLQQQQQQAIIGSPQAASPHSQGGSLPQQHPYAMINHQFSPQQVGSATQSPQLGNAGLAMPMGVGHIGMQNPGMSPYSGSIGLGVGPQVAQSVLRGSSPGPIGSGITGSGSYSNMQMGSNVSNGNAGNSNF
ncbi:hypothetical protein FRC17_011112 [Serendipita sp. 399]|nr:hypothetical protein FRC17_011112 [Serendipita sp. 399]